MKDKLQSVSKLLEGISDDFLECGICMERYTHPKILCGFHSFCEKCLVNYYGNDQVMPCPMCREETKLPVPGGVSGFKTNGFLIKLRDKVELEEKVAKTSETAQRMCELSTENEVTHHCLVPPQIHGRRLDQISTTPRPIKLGELDLGDTKWELHLEVGRGRTEELQFDSVFGIAALRRDRLVVTATRQRLVIFNIAGKLEKTIQIGGSPYSVAASLDRIAVVDNTKCVKMFNEDLTPTIQIRTLHQRELNKIEAHLMCVCMKKDGSTLIGHASKNVITSHSPDGACVNTIPVKARFLTTDSQDRIVLTGYDDNGVIVVGTDGAMLLNMKPTIDGQPVSYSRGVCCDGSDIYVAVSNLDSGSGHIHRYDGDGKFLSCIVQGLRDPQGITLTEDGQHLAVVDSGLVKIYHRV